jgi:Cu/Ag efflux protein CusF
MLRPPHRFALAAALAFSAAHALAQASSPVDGEVRKIDAPHQKITLKHGEIKSLGMPPMTMAYHAKDPAMLKQVVVGDHVRFEVAKIDGVYTLTKLEKLPQ